MTSPDRKKASAVYNEGDSMLYVFTLEHKKITRTVGLGDGVGVMLLADDGSVVGIEIYSELFIENRRVDRS